MQARRLSWQERLGCAWVPLLAPDPSPSAHQWALAAPEAAGGGWPRCQVRNEVFPSFPRPLRATHSWARGEARGLRCPLTPATLLPTLVASHKFLQLPDP